MGFYAFNAAAAGNLTADERWFYARDGENRLISMETLASVASATSVVKSKLVFTCDGQSRRIRKQVFTADSGMWIPSADSKVDRVASRPATNGKVSG